MATEADALALYDLGWCVLPADKGEKTPRGKWKHWQEKRPAREQYLKVKWPASLFVITGSVSRLVVLDCDNKQALKYWRETLGPTFDETTCVISRKGFHFYWRLAEGEIHKSRCSRFGPTGEWDLRCEKGGVIVPPSVHASGHVYSWLRGIEAQQDAPAGLWADGDTSIAPAGSATLGLSGAELEQYGTPSQYVAKILGEVPVGGYVKCPASGHVDENASLQVRGDSVACWGCGYTTRARGLLAVQMDLGQKVGFAWRVTDPTECATLDAELQRIFPR